MNRKEFKIRLRSDLQQLDIRQLLEIMVGSNGEFVVHEDNAPSSPQQLGEILVKKGDISEKDLQKSLAKQKKIGEQLVEDGVVPKEKVEEALKEQRRQKEAAVATVRSDKTANIKVNSEKLDKLFNLIGELVTVQERLSQASSMVTKVQRSDVARVISEFDLEGIAEEISMLSSSLRDNALSIRMLPIESTFNKFRRLVHDLSLALDKEIDLTMSGTETEIDKTVIDKLDEPLMHMIRNCADHGIELPDVREAAGKPRRGKIHLSAEHVSGNVVIHIRDDGAGLNKEAIFNKAVEKELIAPDAQLTDKEIFALIFKPGFSTAAEVTNVSGRGVGMDVVKQTIENLRGHIDVFSTLGQGTQVDITLPLSLAIIDGLLVTIASQSFVLPLSVVEECVELRSNQTTKSTTGGSLATVRGSLVPYVRLRESFNFSGDRPEIEQIVISNVKGQRIGFVVDTVVGEHKTVIKPLGKVYRNVPEFSGASILGDGSIAIIVDASRLV